MKYIFTGIIDGWWIYRYVNRAADRTTVYKAVVEGDRLTEKALHVTSITGIVNDYRKDQTLPDTKLDAWLPRSTATGTIKEIS